MPTLFTLLLESGVNKWKTLPDTVVDLTGRTVILTGSNAGLGFEAAKRFFAMNPARLILAVRTLSKGEDAKRAILEIGKKDAPPGTTRADTNVEVWALDLSSFESVRQFAKQCDSELERLDILLENAAVQSPAWTVTKDGWETDLQTNVLSTFLLAVLLAPLVAKTATLPVPIAGSALKPHLVIVASDAHYIAPLRVRNESNILAALNDRANYIQDDRYADSKTIGLLMTQQLAKIPLLKEVVVCSVNPGFCRSELLRNWSPIVREIVYALFARTATEGSKTYTWASLVNEITPGSYTSSCTVTQAGGVVSSKDIARIRTQLWNEIAAILTEESSQTEGIWVI